MTIGLPTDTLNDFVSRAYFLFKNAMEAEVNPLIPYPDTPYFAPAKEKILSQYPGEDPLKAFLSDQGRIRTVNISSFDYADVIGYGTLTKARDYEKILTVMHTRGLTHSQEFKVLCSECKRSEDESRAVAKSAKILHETVSQSQFPPGSIPPNAGIKS